MHNVDFEQARFDNQSILAIINSLQNLFGKSPQDTVAIPQITIDGHSFIILSFSIISPMISDQGAVQLGEGKSVSDLSRGAYMLLVQNENNDPVELTINADGQVVFVRNFDSPTTH